MAEPHPLSIDAVLTNLDEPYRSTDVCRFHRELTCAEIAHAGGVPESTTRA